MFGAIGGFLGSAIGAVGDYFSSQQMADAQRDINAQNKALAEEQMSWSAGQAQNQMDFQERMSSTAYQRAVDDMKAAGLNPLLAAGASESTPSGAMGSTPGIPSLGALPPVAGRVLQGIASSSKDVIKLLQDVSESNSRISLNKSLQEKARLDAGLSHIRTQSESADAFIESTKRNILEKLSNWVQSGWNAPSRWDGKTLDVRPLPRVSGPTGSYSEDK